MSQRIAISDADDAELGQANRDQFIPIAEQNVNTDVVTPKKTSIRQMNAYFAGGGAAQNAAKILLDNILQTPVVFANDTQPGVAVPFIKVNFQDGGRQVISGEDIFSVRDGGIIIRETGWYHMAVNLSALYANTHTTTGAARWQMELRMQQPVVNELIIGSNYLRPMHSAIDQHRNAGSGEFVMRLEAGTDLQLDFRYRNIGQGAPSQVGIESMLIENTTGELDSNFIITQLSVEPPVENGEEV